MKLITADDLDIYIESNCMTFSDEYGGQYSIECETNGDSITVDTSDLVDGLEHLGIRVHY
jgi:hypothetical protein